MGRDEGVGVPVEDGEEYTCGRETGSRVPLIATTNSCRVWDPSIPSTVVFTSLPAGTVDTLVGAPVRTPVDPETSSLPRSQEDTTTSERSASTFSSVFLVSSKVLHGRRSSWVVVTVVTFVGDCRLDSYLYSRSLLRRVGRRSRRVKPSRTISRTSSKFETNGLLVSSQNCCLWSKLPVLLFKMYFLIKMTKCNKNM